MTLAVFVGGMAFVAVLVPVVLSLFKKAALDGVMEFAAHSGDAETLTFRENVYAWESQDSRQRKHEAMCEILQSRKDWIHARMTKIREKAQKEAEEAAAKEVDEMITAQTAQAVALKKKR